MKMRVSRSRMACLAAVVGAVVSACTGGGTSAGPQPETSAPEKAPPGAGSAKATGDAAPAPTGPNWEIATLPQPPYTAGAEGRFDVRLTGRNGYHVNQEYPIELTIRPVDGVSFPKSSLRRADASAFEEAKAVFPVAFTAQSAGRRELGGELAFSVCNPQNCLLERQPLTIAVDVQ
ncbi:MAG: hypothetical protein HYY06_21285 [Deltaproteobacteria bacterium]|nr:hypothetical protein [Deltaproteobacteria bacterium]